jgi:hypothetical protein
MAWEKYPKSRGLGPKKSQTMLILDIDFCLQKPRKILICEVEKY